ncbi:MAG: T9SS type A sorting domain-containing protein, partial [Candidatus Marinimicrobia bacterium]|nr:T9SS type A sorting domain-containing protein [Candidatus Neomarinimicrobiota bacterium]
GGQAVIYDGTATGYVDDYFMYFRAQNDNNLQPWPANGTTINIQGYVRDIGQDYFSINPRDTNDFEILSNPPVISDITRDIGIPISTEEVKISANITDNGVVDSAVLHYSIDWGAFNEVKMNVARTIYSANIPAQANNSFVRYFISAVDDAGDMSQMPGDTTDRIYYYIVRDGDISIKDVQYTWGYNYDGSGMRGFEVTLEGVVITDTLDWTNNFYIQEKDSMWSGIWVYDDSLRPNKGDWVRITGTVEENYGVTRINDLTDFQVITEGYGVPEPVTVSTFEISTTGDNGEAYESILIQVLNVTVSKPFPDGSGNFCEFEINDGSGGVRVDDAMSSFNGNLDSTYKADHTIEKLIGLGYYSYGDYKMLPRGYDDIIGHVTAVEDEPHIVNKYRLNQNFPNPFNNETTIRFAVASSDPVTLTIYNILGQPIRNLYRGAIIPGSYDISWNGRDNGGKTVSTGIYFYKLEGQDFSSTKKMLFIK